LKRNDLIASLRPEIDRRFRPGGTSYDHWERRWNEQCTGVEKAVGEKCARSLRGFEDQLQKALGERDRSLQSQAEQNLRLDGIEQRLFTASQTLKSIKAQRQKNQ
jgi:hypothetical protein